jgi:hypothetical protein
VTYRTLAAQAQRSLFGRLLCALDFHATATPRRIGGRLTFYCERCEQEFDPDLSVVMRELRAQLRAEEEAADV